MRLLLPITLAAAAAAPVAARPLPANMSDKVTAGRVAGAPRACISRSRDSDRSRIFDDHVIAYDGPGSTIYLNHPAQCDALNSHRGITSRTPSNRLCSGDIVEVVEYQTGFHFGACALGDFTPYSRPGKAAR